MKITITGGCGFIGTNFVLALANEGYEISVIDDLSRPGSVPNRLFLESRLGSKITIHQLDISNTNAELIQHIKGSDVIFHLAAQVAVTTSILDPVRDFEVNFLGTLNILEIIRKYAPNVALIYASTNKVYGDIVDDTYQYGKRYVSNLYPNGIDESIQLSFHSPYGCSKGAADQYVSDYSRIFGISTVVFRQSCIYGDHQYGTEDQGWASWFLINGLRKNPIKIYGTGLQVRDMLHVTDLYEAWMIALKNIKRLSGQAFNIGGGKANAISLLEFIECAADIGVEINYSFDEKRSGDQDIFISNNYKFECATGWSPKISYQDGIWSMMQHLEQYK